MKPVCRTLLVSAVAVILSVATCSLAFAAYGNPDTPPGQPPYGIAMQGDAGGAKLTGVLFIEYSEITGNFANARLFARLRRNNDVKAFYTEALNVPLAPMSALQATVTNALTPHVLGYFFPGQQGLALTLKNMSDFVQLDVLPGETVSSINFTNYYNASYRPWLDASLDLDPGTVPPITFSVPRAVTLVIANIEVAVK